MLKVTHITNDGVNQKFIQKQDLDVLSQDEKLTLKNKSTGEILLQLDEHEYFKVEEC